MAKIGELLPRKKILYKYNFFEPGIGISIELYLQLAPPRATRGGRTLVLLDYE